jgi:hypothetical protein
MSMPLTVFIALDPPRARAQFILEDRSRKTGDARLG